VNFTAMLLALGLTEFSMHPSQLLLVRDRLATLDHAMLRGHCARLLRATTHEHVAELLAQFAA
jgi:phosphotransferase system enzyme I (PtsI)